MASVIVSMRVSVSEGSLQWRRAEAAAGESLPALVDWKSLPLIIVAHPS